MVAGGVGAAIAALLIVPLHNRVLGWAERRFQRDLVSMRDDLPETLSYLRETVDEERLLASSLEQIASGVRATRSAVLVIEEQGLRIAATRETTVEEIEAWPTNAALDPNTDDIIHDPGDPLFPARFHLREAAGQTPIGWLLLGPRPDGSFFGKDEREVLSTLTKPIARTLKIVQVRNRREEANTKMQTKVSGQITRVQRRLLAVEKQMTLFSKR